MIVGLTGGFCSGKSAVAEILADLGCRVIDADALARRRTGPGGRSAAKIRRAFGDRFFRGDGTLDRRSLGELVFSHPAARRKLEKILHPPVAAEIRRKIAAGRREFRGPAVVLDVPLLFEAGLKELADCTFVVTCRRGQQIERGRRRGLTAAEVRARIGAQWTLAEKARRADFVIDNSGTLAETRRRVRRLFLECIAPRNRGAGRAS